MWAIWAPVIGVVFVAATGVVGQLLTSRNDRALTHQEVDLLAKLDPASKAARDLNGVIEARVARWHKKAYKKDRQGREVKRRFYLEPASAGSYVLLGLAMIGSFYIGQVLRTWTGD